MYRNLDLVKLEGEIWKDIEGYEGLYQVSNMGRVKTLNYKGHKGKVRILKQTFEKDGYLIVGLMKDRKIKTIKVHRLVAIAFIENIGDKPCVDHKNTIRTDNRVENLRWSTHKENSNNPLTRKHNSEAENNRHKGRKHSEETKKKFTGRNNSSYKGFIALFPNGNITEEMTKRELGEMLGISDTTVADIAKSNKPYKPYNKKNRHLDGIRIFYAEDYKKLVGDNNVA